MSSSSQNSSQKRKLTPDYVNEDSDAEEATNLSSESRKKGKEEGDDESGNKKRHRNEQGEAYFKLSDKRRISIRKFKGRVLVDIREYFQPEGQAWAPGKKGISLSEEQWDALKCFVKDIDEAIKEIK